VATALTAITVDRYGPRCGGQIVAISIDA
jgi:hypothetical protein